MIDRILIIFTSGIKKQKKRGKLNFFALFDCIFMDRFFAEKCLPTVYIRMVKTIFAAFFSYVNFFLIYKQWKTIACAVLLWKTFIRGHFCYLLVNVCISLTVLIHIRIFICMRYRGLAQVKMAIGKTRIWNKRRREPGKLKIRIKSRVQLSVE